MARVLTPRAEDFPRWYQDLIAKAKLADNGPVRGTMVIRPAGYAIWERMQAEMDARIKAAGAENAYFPLFIPESYLKREAEHVEGFSPELAVVTHGGGKQLAEPVVVRPTSETVIGEFMAKWIDSYRDLPLLLNQWANVVRWELRPRIFLRTSEFLWQEGHTAHATSSDARAYARRILHEAYEDLMVNVLGIPVVVGLKTVRERFAGATATYTCEGMMGDGKALQLGTSHELGQNFAKAFDISYSSAEGGREHAWTTSWGTSTRMLGGLIMAHGDDNGLRVPPRLAPVQAYVMVVKAGDGVGEAAAKLCDALRDAGVRVALDDRTDTPFGRRAVDAELRGYPVRVEVGPRDLAAGNAVVVRRTDGSKSPTPVADVVGAVLAALETDQRALHDQALAHRESRTVQVATLAEAIEAAATGWARVPWSAVGVAGEAEANGQGVTVRCLLRADGSVPDSEDEPDLVAILARAY
ncbi:proline--tRNA ligase [Micromonospora sp. KC207]|uniref:Proline--tRNA ligase n=1 Tax=Micromonospora carbonacea TaxID=47853 RepID=A0A7D6C777_9ACTN|nr:MULTISPECIES: proline--tRNA ligase [unclassified Micromonospora]EEP73940.1 prolyl-tRNA synthetase [Micromonospora sp. ATCC 39149]QLJ99824.1 proline--tRNA ligase [Micromonospora carbonacea]TDC43121.1 proline--tRNA ligase [Micromonospora sp. KC207]